MITALLLTTYVVINIYTAVQTDFWLRRCFHSYHSRVKRIVFYIVYVLLALLPVSGAYLPDDQLKTQLAAAGNLWLGFYIYFTGFLLIAQILRLLIRLASRGKCSGLPRHWAWVALPLMVFLTVSLNFYGILNAQDIYTTNYKATINKDAGNVKHMRVVLVADFHLGSNSDPSLYRSLVRKINAQKPDLVLVGGDIFNSTYNSLKDPQIYSEILSGIKSRYGVYAVYGNHDVEETLFGGFAITDSSHSYRNPKVTAFLKDCGFKILDDRTVSIAGGNVILAGRRDGEKAGDGTAERAGIQSLILGKDTTKPVFVLEHEPMDFANIYDAGADFVFSGHTHDGQIFPGNLVVRFLSQNPYGVRVIDGVTTLTTSGVGYYGPPMRIGTHSEIAVVDFTFKLTIRKGN